MGSLMSSLFGGSNSGGNFGGSNSGGNSFLQNLFSQNNAPPVAPRSNPNLFTDQLSNLASGQTVDFAKMLQGMTPDKYQSKRFLDMDSNEKSGFLKSLASNLAKNSKSNKDRFGIGALLNQSVIDSDDQDQKSFNDSQLKKLALLKEVGSYAPTAATVRQADEKREQDQDQFEDKMDLKRDEDAINSAYKRGMLNYYNAKGNQDRANQKNQNKLLAAAQMNNLDKILGSIINPKDEEQPPFDPEQLNNIRSFAANLLSSGQSLDAADAIQKTLNRLGGMNSVEQIDTTPEKWFSSKMKRQFKNINALSNNPTSNATSSNNYTPIPGGSEFNSNANPILSDDPLRVRRKTR
jgi:hypothetical protein